MANRGRRAWRNILSKRLIVDDYSAINHNERAVAFKQAVNASLHTKELNPDVATKAAMGMGGGGNEDTDNRKREFSADARPGVERSDLGWRWDKNKTYEEGDELRLFPSYKSKKSLSTEPNFGWFTPTTDDYNSFGDFLEAVRNKPRVQITKYKVNPKTDDVNQESAIEVDPFSITSGMSREEKRKLRGQKKSDLEEKSLGRSLKDRIPGGTLIARAAAMVGVVVDEKNKFRCPPGTPAANQFTDRLGTNCFGFSPSRFSRFAAEMAAEVYPESKEGGFRKGVRGLFDFLYTGNGWYSQPAEYGRTPFFDPVTGEPLVTPDWRTAPTPSDKRWLKNAMVNAQEAEARRKAAVAGIGRLLGVDTSPEAIRTNKDLEQIFDKMRETGQWDIRLQSMTGTGIGRMTEAQVEEFVRTRLESTPGWRTLTKREQDVLVKADTIRYYQTERGILESIISEAIDKPEMARTVGLIRLVPMPRKDIDEANTAFIGIGDDIRAKIDINIEEIMTNQEAMLPSMGVNERLAIAAVGTRSDAEAAAAVADFLLSSDVAARAMAGHVSGAYSFAAHIGLHEMQHVYQGVAFMGRIRQQLATKGFIEVPQFDKRTGEFKGMKTVRSVKELTGEDLSGIMLGLSKDINPSAIENIMKRTSVVAMLAGDYPRSLKGTDDPRWLLEVSAELGALREQGFFSGDDLDAVNEALAWTDGFADAEVERKRLERYSVEAAREEADAFTPDEPEAFDIDPDSIPIEEIDAIYATKLKDYVALTSKKFEKYKEDVKTHDERKLITDGAHLEIAALEAREKREIIDKRIYDLTSGGEIKEEEMDEPTLRTLRKLQFERQIISNQVGLFDGSARIAQTEWKKRFSATGRTRAETERWDRLMEDELIRAGWDRKTKKRIGVPDDEDMPDVPEADDPATIRDEVKELLKSDSPEKVEKRIISKLKERALITDKESDEYLRATEELNAMGEEYVAKLRAGGDKRKVATIKRELDEKIYKALSKDRKTKKFKSKAESKEYAKKTRAKHRRKLSPEERRAVDELGAFDSADILKMTDPSQQVSAGRAINSRNARLKRMGMEADPKSVDEGALDEQVQNVLIPAMEAIDKTSVDEPFEIETVMVFDPKMLSGRVTGTELEVKGFVSGSTMPGGKSSVDVPKKGPDGTKARRVVVTVNRGDRGMFSTPQKGDDKDRFVMPPGRFRIVGVDKDGTVRAEYVHQADTREVVGTLAATIGEGTDDAIWRKGQQKKLQKVFARYVVSSGDEGKTPAGSRSKEPSEIRDVSTELVDSVTDMGGSFAEPIDDADVDIPDDSPRKLSSGARDADPIAKESIEATRTRLADAVQTVRLRKDQEREEAVQKAEDKLSRMQSAMRKFEQTGQWDGAEFGVDEITGTPEEIRTTAEAAVTRARREAELERYKRDTALLRRQHGTIDVEDIPEEIKEVLEAETKFIRTAGGKYELDPKYDMPVERGGEPGTMSLDEYSEEVNQMFFRSPIDGRSIAVHQGPGLLEGGKVDPKKTIGEVTGDSRGNTRNINFSTATEWEEKNVTKAKQDIETEDALRNFAESDADELVLTSNIANYIQFGIPEIRQNIGDIQARINNGERVTVKRSDFPSGFLSRLRSAEFAEKLEARKSDLARAERIVAAFKDNDYNYSSAHSNALAASRPQGGVDGYFGRHTGLIVPKEIAEYDPDYIVQGQGTPGKGTRIYDPEMEARWRNEAIRAGVFLVDGEEGSEILSSSIMGKNETAILRPLAPVIGISIPTRMPGENRNRANSAPKTEDLRELHRVSAAINARALRQLQRDGRVDMDTVLTDPTLAPDGMPPRKLSSGSRKLSSGGRYSAAEEANKWLGEYDSEGAKEFRARRKEIRAEQGTVDIEDIPDDEYDALVERTKELRALGTRGSVPFSTTERPFDEFRAVPIPGTTDEVTYVVHSGAPELVGGVLDPSFTRGSDASMARGAGDTKGANREKARALRVKISQAEENPEVASPEKVSKWKRMLDLITNQDNTSALETGAEDALFLSGAPPEAGVATGYFGRVDWGTPGDLGATERRSILQSPELTEELDVSTGGRGTFYVFRGVKDYTVDTTGLLAADFRETPLLGQHKPIAGLSAYPPGIRDTQVAYLDRTEVAPKASRRIEDISLAWAEKVIKEDAERVKAGLVPTEEIYGPTVAERKLSSGSRSGGSSSGGGVSRAVAAAAGGSLKGRVLGKVVDKILDRTGADEDTKDNVKVGLGLISAFGAGGPAGAATYVAIEAARRGGRDLAEFVVDELVERGRMSPEQAKKAMEAVDRIAPQGLPDGAKRKLGQAFSEAADLFERVNTPENRARLAEMSDEAIDSVVEKAKNAKESVREITDTTVESLRDLGRSARELGGSARDRIRGAGTRFRGRRASEGDGPGLKLSSGSRAERKEAAAIHRQTKLTEKEELLASLDETIPNMEKALEEFERTDVWRGADYGAPAVIGEPNSMIPAGELTQSPPRNYSLDEIKAIYVERLGPNPTPEQISEVERTAKRNFRQMVEEGIQRQKVDRRIVADQVERKRIRREQGTLDVEDIPEEILAELEAEGQKLIDINKTSQEAADALYEVDDSSKIAVIHAGQDTLDGGRLSPHITYGDETQSGAGNTKYLNRQAIKRLMDRFDKETKELESWESIREVVNGRSSTATITSSDVLEAHIPFDSRTKKALVPEEQELVDKFFRDGSVVVDFSQLKDGDKRLASAREFFPEERLARWRQRIAGMKKTLDTLKSTGGEFQSAWERAYDASDTQAYYGRYAAVQTIPKDIADIPPPYKGQRGTKASILQEDAYKRWTSQLRGGIFLFVGERDKDVTRELGPYSERERQIVSPLKPELGISSRIGDELGPHGSRGSRIFKALMARAVAQYNRDGRVDIDTVLSDPTLAPEPVRSVTAGTAQATELADIDITGRSEAAIREMREGQKSAGNEWITTKSLFSASTKQAEIPSEPKEKLEQETRSERRKVRSQIVATAIRELKLIIGGASSKEFPGLTRADLDPRLIKLLTREPLEVLNARLEKAAMRMHMGFDRRVRIRLTEQELEQLGKTGIMRVGKFGESAEPSRRAMRLMQMDPEYRANRSNRPITQNKTGLDQINDEILSQGLRLASTILASGKNLGEMSEDEIDMLFNGEVEVLSEKAINPAHTPTFRTKNRSIALAMMAIGQNVELEPSSVTGKVLPEQIVSEATSGALLKVSKDSPEWQDFAEKIGLRSDEMATGEELDNALTQFINDYTIDFCSMPQASGNLLCVKGVEVDRKEMPQLIGQPSNEQSIAARMFINGMLPGTWVSRISSELEETRNKLDSANAALKEDTGEQNIALVNSLKTRVTQLESEELKYRKLVARHESPNPKDTEEIKREEDLLETAIEEFEDRLSELQFLEGSDDMEKASLVDKIDSSRERLEVIRSMRDGKLSDDERKWLHSKTDWSSVMIDVQPLFSEFVGKVLGTFVNDEPDTVTMDPLDIQPTQHSVSARKVNEFAQDIFMEAEIIDEVLKSRGLYPGSESFNAEKAKVLRDNPVGTRIIVTRENQIIDGHHKWAAVLMVNQSLGENSKLPVVVTKIDTNIVQALSLAKAFQNAIGITTDYPKSRSFSTSAVRPIGQQEVDTLMNTLVEDAPKLVDELYDNGHFIKISGVSIPSPMSSGLNRVITKMTESSSSDTADERSRFESGSYRDTRSKQDREMTGSAVDKLRRTRSRLDSALRNANLSKVLLEDVKQAAYFVAMAEKNMPLGVISETARRIMRTSGRTLPELMLTELVNDKKLSPSDKAKIQTQMDRSITRKLNDVERGKLKNGFALAMSSIRQTLNETAVEPEESPFSPVSMARSTIGRRRMDSLRGPVAEEKQPKQQSNTPVVSDFVRRTYAKMGIPMSAPDDMLPIHGYVVHKSHAKSRLDAVRERGLGNIEETAVFELGASDPTGDGIPAYGEIEVVLKKPVSNRAAYSLGQAVSLGGVPVRLNATMREDIADAFYAARNEKGKWANLEAIIGLLTAEITNDYTHVNMTWMGGEDGSHRMFEAFVLGGFDKDEVQQINFPYSMITELADKESISSIVSDKEITAKLQTMGLIPEEIEYVLSMPESQKRTKAEREMKEYLAAQSIKKRLAGMGFENVKIAHPNGFDLDDPRTYSRGARRTDQVLDVLKAKLLDEMVGVAKSLSNDAKKDRSPKIVKRESQKA